MEFRPHISLDVADLDAAVGFYSAVFGTEPTKRYPDYANFRLESPAIHLALVEIPGREAKRRGGEHFGIELFDRAALDRWQGRVESAGIVPRIERSVTCCYAVGDKFWLTDPDGHEWEFWVRSEEADSMHSSLPAQVKSVACCAPAGSVVMENASCCS